MVWLLFLAAIGAGCWWYIAHQNNRQKQLAGDLAGAINDTFGYLKWRVVTTEDAEDLLEQTAGTSQALDAAVGAVEQAILEDGAGVLLGHRRGNARHGIALEQEMNERQEEVTNAREYRQYQRQFGALEKRLNLWEEVLDTAFPVLLDQPLRDRHTYVIGKSGSGKTTLLTFMIYQDLMAGRGVAFLTPEAETIEHEILPYLPAERREEVIYFNPADEQCRHAFNPLHLNSGEDLDRKAAQVFTTLTRLMEGAGSARIHQILRQVIYALVEKPGATLLDIPRLLDRDNPHYRKQVIAQITDEETRRFWKDAYPQFPKNAHVPILTRLARFIRPQRVRNVLCRPEAGLNFREIMDSGKILLCNLSDGLLGEQASELLGGLVMSELQLAAVSRVDTAPERRRRFYVYLDEFQSFTGQANVSYEKLLSRARKYRLPLILAHQQTGQLPPALVREIFGNVSTLVSFLVSRRDANKIARECLRDDWPDRPAVAPEELLTLEVGHAFAKIGTDAFPLEVKYTLREVPADPAMAAQVITASRRKDSKARRRTAANSPAAEERPPETPAAPKEPAGDIPPDPFADLDDPQDLYGS